MSDYETGLIKIYCDEIGALSVEAYKGKDVTERVQQAVKNHCEHFKIIATSSPQRNLEAYRSALNLTGIQPQATPPQVKHTFEYALSVCPTEL